MLGLEIGDSHVLAVSVDEHGRVAARASLDAGSDPAAATVAAFDQVSGAAGARAMLGVAAPNPDVPALSSLLRGLAERADGSFATRGAWPSGACAAVAEAWTGAAAGVADVVYFSASDHMTAGIVRQGAPVLGSRGRAGNVAWLALNPVEREDYRRTGCL
jgi:glucokinase